ncbi:MAG TPA: GNAT family protein, partial [Thermomicrobiales bacterium]|nr:GNAT family protein [Thermomicrobiales bacterium]
MVDEATPKRDPIINIRGEKVGLGPLDASMLAAMTRWINDFQTVRTLAMDPMPMTEQQERQWLESASSGQNGIVFAIYDLADKALVGSTNLFHIDQRHHTCELGIAILDPTRRGKGLGTEAVRLITDYAIHGLEMHNVQLATYEYNHAGQRAYRKAGFKEYGRRREARLHNGQRWDIIFMDVLANEWESPVMERLMAPDDLR